MDEYFDLAPPNLALSTMSLDQQLYGEIDVAAPNATLQSSYNFVGRLSGGNGC